MGISYTKTLYRKVINDNTVTSKIKAGSINVHVKSTFSGNKQICDLLFEIAKEHLNNKQF